MNNTTAQTSCGTACGCSAGAVGTAAAEPVVTGFSIANMDCPSEEAQIRERLGKIDGIRGMAFDLARRHLEVTHEAAGRNAILRALHDIGKFSRAFQAKVPPAWPEPPGWPVPVDAP